MWQFFQNGWEFFNQILYAYYAFLSTLDYNFLFNYLQLWQSYAILSVTTQFTSCVQNVHHQPKHTLAFSDIFPKQLGIFRPNFKRLLNVHTYARMQIFIQLSPTVTKLCHIKCDHPATSNRHVKFGLKIPNHLGENVRKFQGSIFWLTLYSWRLLYYSTTTTTTTTNYYYCTVTFSQVLTSWWRI